MWSSKHDTNFAPKGFFTPPACRKSPAVLAAMPMTERKSNVPYGCSRDLFHILHKVPAGDSPYVRAKHVQLIDKDPGKAISLFWAAINAGDRVDSALKDMAVVMKQLNRSDEAIEAIKSFRHLCAYESQESLDNVLVELYKRSGRIEEEIEMLHRKLKNIEQGIAFGGKRTKIARSQGKKIQITVEQETSRILGNLAWAYLQHHDYGLAENFYRKALALEADINKQCNLAICLMNMNRIPEAKSMLQAVKASCGSKEMDDSYAKSFERAVEMLAEIDSKSVLKPTKDDDWRKLNGSKCLSSVHSGTSNNNKQEHHTSVLYTQPREVSWRSFEGDETRRRYKENEKMTVHTIQNRDGEMLHSTAEKSDAAESKSKSSNMVSPHDERNWRERSRAVVVEGKKNTGGAAMVEPFSQPRIERPNQMISGSIDKILFSGAAMVDPFSQPRIERPNQMISGSIDKILFSDVNISGKVESTDAAGGKKSISNSCHKSWADMAEEDEDLNPCFNDWNEEEYNNENLDCNHQSPCAKSPTEIISQRLEAFDLKDNSCRSNGTPTKNQSVRRSLCFDGKKDLNMNKKKNRLQVFRDITPSPDSP